MLSNWWKQRDLLGLKYGAMFREQSSTAGRGSDVRELELADRFELVYSDLEPVQGRATVSIKLNGKTNKVSVCGCVRMLLVTSSAASSFSTAIHYRGANNTPVPHNATM